jgi:hypothetical protein
MFRLLEAIFRLNVKKYMACIHIQDVLGGVVNIVGGGSMDYSE